jgi:hypothetical protein
MSNTTIVKKRKEKVTAGWSTPVSPQLKEALTRINNDTDVDVHEMTRRYFERLVDELRKEQGQSGRSA